MMGFEEDFSSSMKKDDRCCWKCKSEVNMTPDLHDLSGDDDDCSTMDELSAMMTKNNNYTMRGVSKKLNASVSSVSFTSQRNIFPNSFMLLVLIGALIVGSLNVSGVSASGENSHLQAPRFITQPSAAGSIVSEGRTKILQCHALGSPQPEYRWVKDGQFLGDYSVDHFYKIQHAKRSDSGQYWCQCRNDVGAIQSEKIKVTVAYMTPFEVEEEKTVVVRSGEAAVLELPAISSYPPPSILWQARDNSLLYGSKFASTSTFGQVILDVNAADQKSYRARATNTQLGQEETSGFINLIVTNQGDPTPDQTPPMIIVPPTDAQVIKGTNDYELQCIANARPLHELETIWLKDGVPIETSGIQTSFNDLWNRTLSLLKVDSSHGGQYSCQARLRNSIYPIQSASARVSIIEKPYFVQLMPTEVYGEFGKETVMHCSVGGVPKPNITWYKDTSFINGVDQPGYSVDPETGSLTVHFLRAQDSGMYQCFANSVAGEANGYSWLRVKNNKHLPLLMTPRRVRDVHSKVVRLTINDLLNAKPANASAPVMIKGPENRTVLEGNDITLFCEVGGAPMPNVTWYHNEKEEIVSGGRFQILETGSLLVASVNQDVAGLWTCIRSNEAGTVIGSGEISVLVRTQIIQPPVDTQVILGQIATMLCKVKGDPALPFEIEWEHNDEAIVPGLSPRIIVNLDGTLEIREVRASDVGQYKCIVRSRSQGGHDERVAHLKIIELPYRPSNIHAEKLPKLAPGANSKAVNISWTSGFDGNNPVLKYIVQKRTASPEAGITQTEILSAWETLLANVSADVRNVVVEGLKPATSYQFRISAVNAVGEGEASQASNIVTLPQEPPSGPPVGLVGSARSPSEIIIQWHPPMEEHKNGQILGYITRFRLHGYGKDSPWSIRNITNEAQRNYLIQDLITWKDYEIQIAAYNNKGVGIYSVSLKVKTREGVPSASPTKVRAEAINSTCVKATWKPPDPQQINGINQGYKIQAWQAGELKKTMSVAPSPFDPLAEQTGMICDLEKFEVYNITILCFTNPGDGKKSGSVMVKTNEDVPDEVEALHFAEISDRSVKVVWKRPLKTNGDLLGYVVRYGIKDIPSSFRDVNTTSNVTQAKVFELKASTYYSFEVCGYTQMGRGSCKTASMKSGVEPVLPKPPSSLAVSNIQPFSVVLQFTPGFDGNSSITKWTIQGQTNRNSTWHTIYEYCEEPESSNSNAIHPNLGGTQAVTSMESIVVHNMSPFVSYKLRLIANNVVGPSPPSDPSPQFETLQAPPAHSPRNVTVRAMSATQLRVRWIPLQQTEWYGNPRGYNITYRQRGATTPYQFQTIENPTGNSFVLEHLEEFTLYEVLMTAYNDVGASEVSFSALERTRESVPGIGPQILAANATSSTTIVVRWQSVPEEHCNGIIDGYKVYYGAKNVPFQYKQIGSNATFTTTLTQLKKFIQYHVQVLAYTRVGDGVLSDPPLLVQTWDDVPGPPSNISFPDVSTTTARMIWDAPIDLNGVILAYRITYALEGYANPSFSMEFSPETRTFRATDLEREKYYWFSITAKTRLGWGETAKLLVYTTNNRELPQAPSPPRISPSQVQSSQITFSWTPGRDGFAPIRYYTMEFNEGETHWARINERVSPTGTSYTAKQLKPHTSYRFRIQATNDIGSSSFSQESNITWTMPAAPSGLVLDVQVVPITTTSVRVTWKALPSSSWNGDAETGGYRVEYRQAVDYPVASVQTTPKEEIHGTKASSVVLTDLTRDKNYEISVIPFNSRGTGEASRPITVYVGEAVPTGEPREIKIKSVSSTEVTIEWKPPFQNQQNGDLLGYKIYYQTNSTSSHTSEEELEVVPAWTTSHTLFFLEMFSEYSIRMSAFNPAGDGPSTPIFLVKTEQGPPGPISNITFYDITMTSLKLSWEKPTKPNGEITHYLVTYETVVEASGNSGEDHVISKQVRQKVSCCSLLVENLEEETSYTFSVRGKNSILNEVGPPIWKNVTTGPQPGSPKSIRDLSLGKMFSSVQFKWANDEKSKIQGYYFEAKRRDENRWTIIHRTDNGPLSEFTLSFQNLLPSSGYTFRITAYNRHGISYPVASDEVVYTPPKLYLEYGYLQASPFYRQTWFLVVTAAMSIVFIIALVAYLCVKTKSYKYKHESERSLAETASIEEGVLYGSSVELRQSHKKIGTLKRKSAAGANKPPPRPTPGSVTYTDDESDKAYDHNPDESSLTEKPSEISSTDSQGSETEVEDEVDGASHPHSFVNHYANVNDTLKQSWQKQRPVRNVPVPTTLPTTVPMPNYSSYTDSEPEATASLSGQGRIVLNNMARSRAPLPGFSSFI
ncbi:protein sidekick isoform X3 [Folsomia candida]|uniref:protein sidekick isoform X3 n=1 Tax=Folsomia candida TaxID=158441 RepID=UPI001604AD57|nr:protein sidekick isoform X3 [Folsomia candida]